MKYGVAAAAADNDNDDDNDDKDSRNICSTITVKLQKYTGLKEKLKRIWQLHTIHIVPLVLSTVLLVLSTTGITKNCKTA
jgi:hypothetical protein